ncbi:MAG TPA: DCC1-like thiol-disulfide oxidoreductase family protein [Solirubrobacterales bacterium]|nr:DCC1-like thiol-disulfide oxidoreductase family protein [Solirubrobacterales bacterium]
MTAPAWTVLYDAECGICRTLLAGLLSWDRGRRLRPIALQASEADALLADLPPAERMASWHLLSPAGERWSAGAALPPLLRLLPGGAAPAAAFARFPGATERGYRWVADHRAALARLLPAALKRRADRYLMRRAVPPAPATAPPA